VPLTPLKASMGPIIQRNNKIIAGIWIKPIIKIIVGEAVVKSGCWLPTVPWSWEGVAVARVGRGGWKGRTRVAAFYACVCEYGLMDLVEGE
jgi:hypothetical protein